MKPGTRFGYGAVRPAGHIFYIPPSERPTDDRKNRPHFLVNRCDVASAPVAVATLAHMSTKPTEHTQYGSPVHEIVDPTALTRPDQAGNYVIAARLLARDPHQLTRSARSAVGDVRSVRQAVLTALGVGKGLAATGARSVRGRLVRVRDPRAGSRYGCVLTDHAYSSTRRYQIIVPIIDRVVDGPEGPELLELMPWDVAPPRHPWWDALPFESPILDTAWLNSLSERWQRGRDSRWWLDPQIEVLGASIDDATLAAVETRIVERLTL
jgi:hypothetical protein